MKSSHKTDRIIKNYYASRNENRKSRALKYVDDKYFSSYLCTFKTKRQKRKEQQRRIFI